MTIALLSNVTLTSVAMRVNKLTQEEIFYPQGYNTWLQEITHPQSKLYEATPEVVFIVLHGRSLLGEHGDENAESAEHILQTFADTIARAADQHRDTTFVVSTIDVPHTRIRPLVSHRAELAACAFWRHKLEKHAIPILELAELAAEMGRTNFYNNRVWYMGSMPFSKLGEEAVATEINRIWHALHGRRKKCLALDLDNTLWGGVIGELELDGVHLDAVGSGARFYDMQKRILDLKRSGVLLAIISKNNLEDALEGINRHPYMLLREDDFVAIRANWEPKAENLRSIARELNIGTDSFVFVDDNPVEREMMQITLPEVAVPAFPEDTAQLEHFMLDVAREYFLQVRITAEDEQKTEQYKAEVKRSEQKSAFENVADYLKSLDMILFIEKLNSGNLPRAAQLTQKTNQFNLTTRRYTEADLHKMQEGADYFVYIGELKDRFGDYGKVILCIAKLCGKIAVIDTFLMSCRVMGRGVEKSFLREVEKKLYTAGAERIAASFVPSQKNGVVKHFWSEMNYVETDVDKNGTIYYGLLLPHETIGDDIITTVES